MISRTRLNGLFARPHAIQPRSRTPQTLRMSSWNPYGSFRGFEPPPRRTRFEPFPREHRLCPLESASIPKVWIFLPHPPPVPPKAPSYQSLAFDFSFTDTPFIQFGTDPGSHVVLVTPPPREERKVLSRLGLSQGRPPYFQDASDVGVPISLYREGIPVNQKMLDVPLGSEEFSILDWRFEYRFLGAQAGALHLTPKEIPAHSFLILQPHPNGEAGARPLILLRNPNPSGSGAPREAFFVESPGFQLASTPPSEWHAECLRATATAKRAHEHTDYMLTPKTTGNGRWFHWEKDPTADNLARSSWGRSYGGSRYGDPYRFSDRYSGSLWNL